MVLPDSNEPLSEEEFAVFGSQYLNADALYQREHVRIKNIDRCRRALIYYPGKKNDSSLLVGLSELKFIS
jgi:hypothetical protein